ncbi:MAG TPA: Holliday junction resolvase RuvX [Candidatus Caccopulliclostridium gallistercoris]|uniref:Putative pre-16S rRNA nuclease n=1 Tax=Candidatus Caccopulliclostridium gallistercoris TaxID=2840719 RepID=A0A9D1NEF7_9FIRM|nr:Holliday junction resolvase RuvX [Candidatus Caccopulliclostridium gallistercoris]
MQYGRIMGIDYGKVRIGIALTDLLKTIASPYEVYKSVSLQKDVEYFVKLVKEKEVEKIVLGLPLNMDGSEGERAKRTRIFGEMLEKACSVPVVYQDERLSSVEAENYLLDGDVRRDKRKNLIDKVAATIILEDYLRTICK